MQNMKQKIYLKDTESNDMIFNWIDKNIQEIIVEMVDVNDKDSVFDLVINRNDKTEYWYYHWFTTEWYESAYKILQDWTIELIMTNINLDDTIFHWKYNK